MVQYIDDFLTYLKDIKNASPNTISAYHNDLKKFKLFMEKLELSNLTQISETILNSYILNLENQGFSNASVSRNIASIKSFMLFLLKEGVISKDPSERLKPPKTVKKPPRTINVEQINQLLDKPDLSVKKGIRDKAMLELLYATGMKVSELVSIKISDINLERGYISCGKKRERNIPFGDLAKRSIQNYLEIRQDEFDKKNSCYLFLNYSGDKLSRQGFWKILKNMQIPLVLKI